ncbi:hypothetical protein SteCoe_1994 [Stentor coeruleus]|uniref:Thioredoxin domain-containing protein n=1 Tax=Stentor coeruleus TaxID=5963 RepID=A0A1R2D0R6_9CILI|nr:hypothetical protein SteCoe_1994 [Stentor coeruleus]
MLFCYWSLLILTLIAHSKILDEYGVWVIDDDNYEEALMIQHDLLIEFYTPSCEFCKEFSPDYSLAARTLAKNDPPIYVAKVDASVNIELVKRFSIKKYPTFKYIIDKEVIDYTGGYSEDRIVAWIKSRSNRHVKILNITEQIDKSIEENIITALLIDSLDSTQAHSFLTACKAINLVNFIQCACSACANKYTTSTPTLLLFKPYDERLIDYIGDFSSFSLISFINKNKLPSFIDFNQDAVELIFGDSNPGIFIFTTNRDFYEKWFRLLGKEYKGILLFSIVDADTTDWEKIAHFFDIKKLSEPVVVLLDTRNNQRDKYRLESEINEKNVKEFIEKWKNGMLEVYRKSQKIPEKLYENNVLVVVGECFDDVVMDMNKDVLIAFYIPYSRGWRDLVYEYEFLAEELEHLENLVFGKIDSTENQLKAIKVESTNSVYFFPADNKKGIEYNGEKNADGILEFVKKYAFYEITELKDEL